MATIINNPPTHQVDRVDRVNDTDRGIGGFLIGLAVLIILAILLFAFGIPALRRSNNAANNSPAPNVNIGTPGNSANGPGSAGAGSSSGSTTY